MSTERKNPFKRDQALNDATSGQLRRGAKVGTIPRKGSAAWKQRAKGQSRFSAPSWFLCHVYSNYYIIFA